MSDWSEYRKTDGIFTSQRVQHVHEDPPDAQAGFAWHPGVIDGGAWRMGVDGELEAHTPAQEIVTSRASQQALIDAQERAQLRPAREIALATAVGLPAPADAVQRLSAIEAEIARLRLTGP